MRQLSRCTSRLEIMNHFCTVYGTCRSMMTPIVDEGMFIYFISNSETRRELRDSFKILRVPTRSRSSEIPISSSHADSEKLGKIRMLQKRSRTRDLPIIIIIMTQLSCDTPWTEIVVMSALSEVCQTKMMANMSPVNHVEPTTPPLSFTTIRLLETREGRGKETRVSRAFGSKENPLNSSKGLITW